MQVLDVLRALSMGAGMEHAPLFMDIWGGGGIDSGRIARLLC